MTSKKEKEEAKALKRAFAKYQNLIATLETTAATIMELEESEGDIPEAFTILAGDLSEKVDTILNGQSCTAAIVVLSVCLASALKQYIGDEVIVPSDADEGTIN